MGMREIVISSLMKSKWYQNLSDETEGNPPLLASYTDTALLGQGVESP